MEINKNKILEFAKEVFTIEVNEILRVQQSLDDNFIAAIQAIYESTGKLIVVGIGKSGIIGKKIAASLASTGTPSFFVHPSEAFHGDLGMFEQGDIVLMLSNSGETDEVLKILSFFHSQGNKTISITSNNKSTLAKNTNFHILCKVEREACPMQLAPTSSTTAALVIGDAMAVALMHMRNFQPENFAVYHPGGALGKKLLTQVKDLMITSELPFVTMETSIKDVIHVISDVGIGVAILVDIEQNLEGIITDGDIRRAMENFEDKFFTLKAGDIATKKAKAVSQNDKASLAEKLMRQYSINTLVVVADNNSKNIVGVLQSEAVFSLY